MIETVGETEQGYDAVEAQLAAEGAQLDERERRVFGSGSRTTSTSTRSAAA